MITADFVSMQLTTIREQFEHSLRLLGARETELRAGSEEIDRLAHQLGAAAAESARLGAELEDEALLRGAHDERRREWRDLAGTAIGDAAGLRAKIARKAAVEAENARAIDKARSAFDQLTAALETDLTALDAARQAQAASTHGAVSAFAAEQGDALTVSIDGLSSELAKLATAEAALRLTVDGVRDDGSRHCSAIDDARRAFVARFEAASATQTQADAATVRTVLAAWNDCIAAVRLDERFSADLAGHLEHVRPCIAVRGSASVRHGQARQNDRVARAAARR